MHLSCILFLYISQIRPCSKEYRMLCYNVLLLLCIFIKLYWTRFFFFLAFAEHQKKCILKRENGILIEIHYTAICPWTVIFKYSRGFEMMRWWTVVCTQFHCNETLQDLTFLSSVFNLWYCTSCKWEVFMVMVSRLQCSL